MNTRVILAGGLCATAISLAAHAQEGAAHRQDFEFSIGLPYLQSETTTFDGGTVVNTGSSTGLGFSGASDDDFHLQPLRIARRVRREHERFAARDARRRERDDGGVHEVVARHAAAA